MKRTNTLYRLLMILFCIALPMAGFAQPDPPDDIPVDGGLSLLLAAGAAYGVKKYRDGKKKREGEGRS